MDEAAWIDLYRRCLPGLYRSVSRRVGGDHELAEDVTQETWLRALDAWRTKGRPRDPETWLLTVAGNLLRNHVRARRPSADVRLEDLAAPTAAEHADGETRRAALLQCGLAKLRTNQAELLVGRHFDGRSLAELAEAHGLSERAVEGRLRRARAALERRLGGAATELFQESTPRRRP